MKPTFTQAADFRQQRDFSQKIGSTFEFLGAHWRPLGKCLLYFVLPLSLILGVGLGLLTNTIWNVAGQAQTNPGVLKSGAALGASYFSGFGLAMLGGVLAFLMAVSTVHSYVRLLLTTEPAVAPTPAEVWVEIRSRLGRLLLACLLLFGVYAGIMLVVGLVVGGSMAAGGGPFVFLLVLILMPLLLYLLVPLTLYFPVLWLEDEGLFAALRRCYYLVKGKWWATFGLFVIAGMIQGMMSFIFVLPQYAVLFGKMLHIPGLDSDLTGMVAQTLYASGTMLLYPVSLLAMIFQYFNLVERKEGLGLLSRIANLGSGLAPAVENATFRPDDEGNY
ncbi:hypothetical protein CDA63_03280 [Hymenobacter amundsenii]|uniref:DUF7847 domain-containing protein n=1 Tax=Hymenobacter amundsenii TaxID=2006685 RepID=A0A246FRL7_9BACT|nr:hypothetical protein [Hymenobacter amundsenii]OWP64414.1 hypothetical protein CDA63_03280 [Hymenobacter amundsenii]